MLLTGYKKKKKKKTVKNDIKTAMTYNPALDNVSQLLVHIMEWFSR